MVIIMIKFLQINLRKSGSAMRLIEQTSRELRADILLMSEIPRGLPNFPRWKTSMDGKVAVALTSSAKMAATDSGRGLGFALMQLPSLLVYSCYWKPGSPLHEFKGFLSGLNADLRSRGVNDRKIIIAGISTQSLLRGDRA